MKVHQTFREAFIHNKVDHLYNHATKQFKVPEHIRVASQKKAYKEQAKRLFGEYLNGKRPNVVIKKVDDAIGLGVYSTKRINAGITLREVTGYNGTRLTSKDATNHISSITNINRKKALHYCLTGSIAFINHACETHANCVVKKSLEEDEKGKMDWLYLQTDQVIAKDTELTIFYDKDCM